MVPFASFAQTGWITAPVSLYRFIGYPALRDFRAMAPGAKLGPGDARDCKARIANPGVSVAWSGQSYQQQLSSGQAPILYGLALIVIFLCLAALYESWSIPVAVLLVIPLGLIGAILVGHPAWPRRTTSICRSA